MRSLRFLGLPILLTSVWLLAACDSGIKPGADLSGRDLSGRDLRDVQFNEPGSSGAKANLSEANLSEANLEGVMLYGVDLSYANLTGANLSGACFYKANLSGTDFGGADLSGADLPGAWLANAKLSGADLDGANLSGADLPGAWLDDAKLSGAYLDGANLSGAVLTGARLDDANLSGADLSGAWLDNANLSGAVFTGARLDDANLSGADLGGTDLSRAELGGANLTGANLSAATLFKTSMSNAEGVTDEMLKRAACGGSIWLASVQDGFASVCQGTGIPEAESCSDGPGLRPLVMFEPTEDSIEDWIHWNSSLPDDWHPAEIQSLQLVACVTENDRLIDVCSYTDGTTIRRYQCGKNIKLVEARTGKPVAVDTLLGPMPWPCAEVITSGGGTRSVNGGDVQIEQIIDWLAPYVEP